METEAIIADLRRRLSPRRLKHTISVARTAARLAVIHGEDPERAYIAGILHDCAKGLEGEALKYMGELGGADADEIHDPSLAHAPAGAILAKLRYGVTDAGILSAIRRHTVGGSGMTKFDAILYVADFIEPERGDFPGFAEARALADDDIFAAAAKCARLTTAYAAKRGHKIHPATPRMIAEIEK